MPDYGVTDKGFVLKRMDTILEEVHEELTAGYGVDTRLLRPSFLDVLVTTFCGQIADLWETAQDSYYAKYPTMADGINLDHAVQYGGIRRKAAQKTCYPLHCTGRDGTFVREGVIVATDTNPEVRLSSSEFLITRSSCNGASIRIAAAHAGVYTIAVNGVQYSYSSTDGTEKDILLGLKEAVTDPFFELQVKDSRLIFTDTMKTRSNALVLSENLTTETVTTIANFYTEDYGKVVLPYGIIRKMINNISGFDAVTNLLEPVYGRLQETDIELRQSYIAKSALRSNTMVDSIVSELLNNVSNIESASGYENDTDMTDARGLPPHSVEIIVEGGGEQEIASAILMRKAGGIWTHGSIKVSVPTDYGDSVDIRFNRPERIYAWLKVKLKGDAARLPVNYAELAILSILEDGSQMVAGTNLITQLLNDGIYGTVSGITRIDILTAYSADKTYVPEAADYTECNIMVSTRQKISLDEKRIEVSFDADE
ncbi:MAG: hypothetical protein HFI14_09080 [Lachnospiraceae bacterium]|nr:hypothetical protein [Lachnospiraceae bacterium]